MPDATTDATTDATIDQVGAALEAVDLKRPNVTTFGGIDNRVAITDEHQMFVAGEGCARRSRNR